MQNKGTDPVRYVLRPEACEHLLEYEQGEQNTGRGELRINLIPPSCLMDRVFQVFPNRKHVDSVCNLLCSITDFYKTQTA